MSITTLSPIQDVSKRSAITYHPNIFPSLNKIFKRTKVKLVPKSDNILNKLFISTKDRTPNDEKPGIYICTCKGDDLNKCGKMYIGQTKRELKTRIKEHLNYIKKLEPYHSGLAEHAITEHHKIKSDDFCLVEREQHYKRLNILESIHIYLNGDDTVNRDAGPYYVSNLFPLLSS